MMPDRSVFRVVSFLIICIFIFQTAYGADERASIRAVRTSEPPTINGDLRDDAWQQANSASGFYQYQPYNDRMATYDTEVRVLYDDHALYIAAKMFDPAPDSILQEMGLRNSGDNLNADRFYVDINPFDDGINGFRFQVSASGVQTDANMAGGGRHGDLNWDAVWESAVMIVEDGWQVEIKIPYSALRFPRGNLQEWGINFWREIRRTRETSSWNFVDRHVGDPLAYMGQLKGVHGIDPPLRLLFYPYISNYIEKNGYETGWANSFNGGMDLKYGITPSFTMDMTLIPDFGQVQSDEKVLDLSPFEVKYDENRQFFTEGTELFEKADLFYSRRIGDMPVNYHRAAEKIQEHEVITDNPLETRMINATKISGRTAGGLGIGFFNAMTAESNAILLDTLTSEAREVTTQPFTNYNLFVFDQSMKNNSFVSLINTNVARAGSGYTANVSGTEFRLMDSSNMYRISGSGALSQQYYSDINNSYGHKYDLSIGKSGGVWQYNYHRNVISDTYNQDDMGFLRRNNQINDGVSVGYNIYDPFWRFLMLINSFSFTYSRLYEPRTFTSMELGYYTMIVFDTRFHIRGGISHKPKGERDYYEPRVAGRYYRTDSGTDMRFSFSSDYRKKVYVDGRFSAGRHQSIESKDYYGFNLEPTWRVSDQLNMSYGFHYQKRKNDIGYVGHESTEEVYFGRRQSPTVTNTLNSTYIFNNDLSLDLSLRHYWSRVDYDGQYYLLQEDGRLSPTSRDIQANDINYNAYTLDMLLTWHFAPGSQMTLAWKHAIDSAESEIPSGYVDNVRHMLDQPQINSISIKVLYYIDFHSIKELNQRLFHNS